MSPTTYTAPTLAETNTRIDRVTTKPAPKKSDFSGFGQFLRSLFSSYPMHASRKVIEKREAKRLDAARQAFSQRSKHTSHRLNCLQGYRAKADLVRQGRGRNSLAGVPSAYRGTPA